MTAPYIPQQSPTAPAAPPQPPQPPPFQPPPVGHVYTEQPRGYPPSQIPQPPQPPQAQPQQQPQAQPQYQQPAAQPQAQPQVDPNGVVPPGIGLPNELVGRPWSEVARIYGGLRDYYFQSRHAPARQPAQPQAPAQQPQQQPQQPTQTQTQHQPTADFWTDPAAFIRNTVQEVVAPMMAPVVQQTALQQAQQAEASLRSTFPDYDRFRPAIMQALQGVDPTMLADPTVWQAAYYMEKGKASSQPQPPGGQQPARQGQAPGTPVVVPPPSVQMNPSSFFAENPLPPPTYGQQTNGPGSMSMVEMEVARRFGMTPEAYMAWRGGMPQTPTRTAS